MNPTPTTTFPPGGPLRLIPWEPAQAELLRAPRFEGAAPRFEGAEVPGLAFASTPSAERVRTWVRERFGRELTRIEWPT